MSNTTRTEAISAICWEAVRQDLLHGPDRDLNPDYWLRILVEEVGEIAAAIDHRDLVGMGVECVQVAAVALQMVEWLLGYRPDFGREAMMRVRIALDIQREKAMEARA